MTVLGRAPNAGRWAWVGWVGMALLGLPSCQAIDRPGLEECGNGIVEPGAGEDCEPVGSDAVGCGTVGSGAGACRFLCTEQACPTGYRCGLDAICRRPCLGLEQEPTCNAFETLSSDVTTEAIAQLSLVNMQGDQRPEIVAVEYRVDDPTEAVLRAYSVDDDETIAGTPAAVGEFPRLVRFRDGGAVHLVAQRNPLGPSPAMATAVERQAVVSALDVELSFSEVLMQGPDAVDPGPLRLASFAPPTSLPPQARAAALFGFRDGAVWQADEGGLVLPELGDPDALIGPVFGQPLDTQAAIDAGHLASAGCDVMIYGYQGAAELAAANLCDGVADGWTSMPLLLPRLPAGVRLGDGVVLSDINGDGLDDLALTTSTDRIVVAYAVGDGSFHSEGDALPPSAGDGLFDDGIGVGSEHPWPADASLGVLAVGDFNGDGRPDFFTRSTWIRSCELPDCGTCDVAGYRCDVGPQSAAGYRGAAASVVDYDGDGTVALAVLAREAEDAWFPPTSFGAVPPAAGDLVIIDRPGSDAWSSRVIALPGDPTLLASGDLNGDGADEIVLRRQEEAGDQLLVVFGGDGGLVVVDDFARIVDVHVQAGEQVLAVVSEDLDGMNRRLSRLSATLDRQLVSTTKLALEVVPRTIISGHFNPADPSQRGLALLGESPMGETAVELVAQGGSSFFDSSSRTSQRLSLGFGAEHATATHGVALDLDGDDVDELIVFGADGVVQTLAVMAGSEGPAFMVAERSAALPESYLAPRWPGDDAPVSRPRLRDLDADGDLDIWMLTAESPPRLAAFRNLGDGRLDIEGRAVSSLPAAELSVCEDDSGDCTVLIRAFAAFSGPTDRTASVSPTAVDVLLVARRALFLWTVDPLDPATADARELVELAVIRGGRLPLSPMGGQVFGAIGDIDGDGVDDVVAAGQNGIRWLNGLAVNP